MPRRCPSTLAFVVGLAVASCAAPARLPPPAPVSSTPPPPSPAPGGSASATAPSPDAPAPSPAPNGPAEPDRDIDEALRSRVVATLGQRLTDEYAFAEMGARLAQALRERQATGAYASTVTASTFTRKLTQDVQDISRDRHLRVFFRPGAPSPSPLPDPEKSAGGVPPRRGPPLDGAIHRIEVLPGNIGYLQVDGVPPLPLARGAIDAAFAFLRHTDALILDCRGNNGGDPNTVAYYVSYLTEGAPFVINTFHPRNGEVHEFATTALGQLGYGERKPVWVLTSARTFSGGEELAYDLQSLRRARLVGEVTGGGANPARPVPLLEGFVAAIPFAHPVNPITKGNWEGTGVQPDVAVPAAKALDVALAEARARVSGANAADPSPASAPALPARKRPQSLEVALSGAGAGALRGPNLIPNGDFARGLAPWGALAFSPAGPAPHPARVVGGALCAHVESASHIVLRGPKDSPSDAFAIRAGVPYRLSFRISASGRLPLQARLLVGMAPNPAVVDAEVPLDVRPTLLHVDFRSKTDEPHAGVNLHLDAPPSRPDPGSQVCVDDFVLREIVP